MSAAAVLASVACIGGCEGSTSPAVDVVQSYLSSIAEGDGVNACSLFDPQTKESLLRRMPPRTTCPSVFGKCLPDYATIINKDQAQLLYANIDVAVHGSTAKAAIGGTATGKALKYVTLRDERGVWRLTSFGQAIETCRPRGPHVSTRSGHKSPTA